MLMVMLEADLMHEPESKVSALSTETITEASECNKHNHTILIHHKQNYFIQHTMSDSFTNQGNTVCDIVWTLCVHC